MEGGALRARVYVTMSCWLISNMSCFDSGIFQALHKQVRRRVIDAKLYTSCAAVSCTHGRLAPPGVHG